jgi:hypothetical protein
MISRRYGVREVFHAPASALPSPDRMRFASDHSDTSNGALGRIARRAARKQIGRAVISIGHYCFVSNFRKLGLQL